jgi:hypothetical protein
MKEPLIYIAEAEVNVAGAAPVKAVRTLFVPKKNRSINADPDVLLPTMLYVAPEKLPATSRIPE